MMSLILIIIGVIYAICWWLAMLPGAFWLGLNLLKNPSSCMDFVWSALCFAVFLFHAGFLVSSFKEAMKPQKKPGRLLLVLDRIILRERR